MGVRPERYEPRGFGGRNRFWLRGRCVTGPDYRGTALTLLLIIFIALLSGGISFYELYKNTTDKIAFIVLLSIMLVSLSISLWSCWLAATTDPGIIPRSTAPPPTTRRDRNIVMNGRTVLVKFCETCRIWRPPRASHCATCNNCVLRFDHHCPWLGNDIGIRNYRSYFTFVSSSAVGSLSIIIASVWALVAEVNVELRKPDAPNTTIAALGRALRHGPSAANFFVIILCMLAFAFTGGLTGFHIYLMSNNVTTAESFKKAQRNSAYDHDDLRGCSAILHLQCTMRPNSAISRGFQLDPYPDFQLLNNLVAQQIEDERIGRLAQGGQENGGDGNVRVSEVETEVGDPIRTTDGVTASPLDREIANAAAIP